jgi:hypothetical protein
MKGGGLNHFAAGLQNFMVKPPNRLMDHYMTFYRIEFA